MKNAFEYEAELTALREELETSRVAHQITAQVATAAAEQRNAELIELVREVHKDYRPDIAGLLWKRIDDALKPTESGASEPCAHSYANRIGCPECGEEFKPTESGASE